MTYDEAVSKLLERRRPNRVLAALGRFFIRCLMAEQETRIAACKPPPVMGNTQSNPGQTFVPRPPSIQRPDKPVYDPLFGSDNGVQRK